MNHLKTLCLILLVVLVNKATALSITQHNSQLIDALNQSRQSIDLAIYSMAVTRPSSTHGVLKALVKAKNRGVLVRILLNDVTPEHHYAHKRLIKSLQWCQENHIRCTLSPSRFIHSHEKYFIIDHHTAIIMTGNLPWCPKHSSCAVNFMAFTDTPEVVRYLEGLFSADWTNLQNSKNNSIEVIPKELLVSPINSAVKMSQFMRSARQSLILSMPFLDKATMPRVILHALKTTLARGVAVTIITSDGSRRALNQNLQRLCAQAPHCHLSRVREPFMHAKVIVVDQQRALLGSINWSTTSLYRNREVGIIINDRQIARQLQSNLLKYI
jgi:cardiolipin synthase